MGGLQDNIFKTDMPNLAHYFIMENIYLRGFSHRSFALLMPQTALVLTLIKPQNVDLIHPQNIFIRMLYNFRWDDATLLRQIVYVAIFWYTLPRT